MLNLTSEFLDAQSVGVQMVLKEGGASFLVCRCAIALNGQSSDGLERRWATFLASLSRCAVWLVSMLAYVLVSILRMFVLLPCRAGVSPMSVHVDFSFPCRNCFPKESGVFWST